MLTCGGSGLGRVEADMAARNQQARTVAEVESIAMEHVYSGFHEAKQCEGSRILLNHGHGIMSVMAETTAVERD
jgi:hypothetical protein